MHGKIKHSLRILDQASHRCGMVDICKIKNFSLQFHLPVPWGSDLFTADFMIKDLQFLRVYDRLVHRLLRRRISRRHLWHLMVWRLSRSDQETLEQEHYTDLILEL